MKYLKVIKFIKDLYKERSTGVIPLHEPVFRGNEMKYLSQCIESTYVSSVGRFVDELEDVVAKYTNSEKAVACVNGTNALFIALKILNITDKDEVITQPLSFIATANAIVYTGAHPIFVDVDRETLGLSPKALKYFLETNCEITSKGCLNKLTNRIIKACVPMHTFGIPCDIEPIKQICEKYNIILIEDAAESLGSFIDGRHTGSFGEIGVLSFNGNKTITTGGGGMLLFKDMQLAKKAKHITTQAKVAHPWEFNHDDIGYNFRMPNLNAAIGLAQFENLKAILQSKKTVSEGYRLFFNKNPHLDITYVQGSSSRQSNNWLNTVIAKSKSERDVLLKELNENGIQARPAWNLINNLPMYKNYLCEPIPNAEYLQDRIVNLPSSARL